MGKYIALLDIHSETDWGYLSIESLHLDRKNMQRFIFRGKAKLCWHLCRKGFLILLENEPKMDFKAFAKKVTDDKRQSRSADFRNFLQQSPDLNSIKHLWGSSRLKHSIQ